jgi:hypothetical protein
MQQRDEEIFISYTWDDGYNIAQWNLKSLDLIIFLEMKLIRVASQILL